MLTTSEALKIEFDFDTVKVSPHMPKTSYLAT